MESYFGKKHLTVNDWLNDKKRPIKITQRNVKYLGLMKEASAELGRISMVTYFLLVKCGMKSVRQMMNSSVRQRKFMKKVISELKKYEVTNEYERAFEKSVESARKRIDHVYKIIRENVRLTEFYPYFEQVGFKRLLDYSMATMAEGIINDEEEQRLYERALEWNRFHKEEVEEHMNKIRPEMEMLEERRRRIAEERRIERETLKAIKKAEEDEAREMRKNEKKWECEVRKANKMLERYANE